MTGEVKALHSEPVFGAIYPGDASVLGDPAVDVAYRWIRSGDFKLIVPHAKDGKVWGDYGNLIQLYNLAEDPDETENLASDLDRETIDRLHVKLGSMVVGRRGNQTIGTFIPHTGTNLKLDILPESIARDGDSAILIKWTDGRTTRWSASALRAACPCATCREKKRANDR